MFELDKFSLIIVTRCNLRCKLCCEYVPQNKPFPDMTVEEERAILENFFECVDRVKTLHLTGGGEPFLHKGLPELIEEAMKYRDKFDRLMLFTNSTVKISRELADALTKYKDKIFVQVSHYHQMPDKEEENLETIKGTGVSYRVRRYYGEDQDFGGWVDFGTWESKNRTEEELEGIFKNCSVTEVMHGNWRTRDGKVFWCSRAQRGTELGLLPDYKDDYVDLFDESLTAEEKREKFIRISKARYINACNHCSGDQGTDDKAKRYPAAQQME